MPNRRVGFGAGSALALSVVVHLAFLPFVHVARASAEPERSRPPDVVRFLPSPHLRPPPTARPTASPTRPPLVAVPRPPSRPRRFAAARARPLAPRLARAETGDAPKSGDRRSEPTSDGVAPRVSGDASADADAPAAASPEISATPTPACDAPASAARVTMVAEPEMPEAAQERQAFGVVDVRVDLDDRGDVLATAVASSPSELLDAAALDAARRSTYAPEIRDCRPVAGSYLFRVDFDG